MPGVQRGGGHPYRVLDVFTAREGAYDAGERLAGAVPGGGFGRAIGNLPWAMFHGIGAIAVGVWLL